MGRYCCYEPRGGGRGRLGGVLGTDGLELLLGGADDLVDLARPEGVLGDGGAVNLEGGHGADAAHAGELL